MFQVPLLVKVMLICGTQTLLQLQLTLELFLLLKQVLLRSTSFKSSWIYPGSLFYFDISDYISLPRVPSAISTGLLFCSLEYEMFIQVLVIISYIGELSDS